MKSIKQLIINKFNRFSFVLLILTAPGVSGQINPEESRVFNVSADEFYTLINAVNGNIIDVRTLDEYNSGHIENAMLIDYYRGDLQHRLDSLDKSVPVLIYCRSGNRSATATNIMEFLGFRLIYNLENGIISWKEANFELITE
ncbi:MAG: rhodanese-like domain-containing protein [Bacteroidales bacterium]|jgi:rhodanese-related sulfurtransferase|nr:rhodanese-like domain-containing protein [Bacteroidales bacterium]